MNGVVDLSLVQVLAAYVFVLILGIIVKSRGIRREREIVLASVRMTLQLIFVGHLLRYVFDNPTPWTTVPIIAVMEAFAVYTVLSKFRGRLPKGLGRIVVLAMTAGTLASIIYFLFVVVRVAPWFDPRYFIPIAGMLIGNSMTGISLGVHALTEGMSARRSQVEEALVLGAAPKDAVREIVDGAFDAAILPTLNSMMGMGIVFLPGMMTGQILSGTAPTTAIAYQIAIMLGILGAVALSVVMLVQLGWRPYFNRDRQLVD
jgi:putative ABC transport system permease protein